MLVELVCGCPVISGNFFQVAVEQMWAIKAVKYAETHFKVSYGYVYEYKVI